MDQEKFIETIMEDMPDMDSDLKWKVRSTIDNSYEKLFDEVYECVDFDVSFTDMVDRRKNISQPKFEIGARYTLYIGAKE